ncbi:unnamed protein product [Closterium sp. Yama58-4]|nr:unnamed protein product [Closterium sp. Yama58-4]
MPSPVEGSIGGTTSSGGSGVPITSGIPKGVVMRDIEELQRKKQAMRAAGRDTVQVIADFDRTLTKFTVNGKPGQSCHMLLNLRHPELEERGRRLTAKYLPMETDPHLPYEEKFKCMVEWWTAAHELLLESGITRADVTQSVAAANTAFRVGFCDMLALLEAHGVPLLIFSAGLADVIEELLHQQLPRSFSNVRVVSNRMQFDESGRLVAFPGRIIHVLNKNEHALELAAMEEASAAADSDTHGHASTTAAHTDPGSATQVLTMAPQGVEEAGTITAAEEVAEVRSRTNVILLGDHLGDLGMSEGVSISNQISVGFLNHDVDRQLELYKRSGKKTDVIRLSHRAPSSTRSSHLAARVLCDAEPASSRASPPVVAPPLAAPPVPSSRLPSFLEAFPRRASARLAAPPPASPRLRSPRRASACLAAPPLASPRLRSPRRAAARLAAPPPASPRLRPPRRASARLPVPPLTSPRLPCHQRASTLVALPLLAPPIPLPFSHLPIPCPRFPALPLTPPDFPNFKPLLFLISPFPSPHFPSFFLSFTPLLPLVTPPASPHSPLSFPSFPPRCFPSFPSLLPLISLPASPHFPPCFPSFPSLLPLISLPASPHFPPCFPSFPSPASPHFPPFFSSFSPLLPLIPASPHFPPCFPS